MKVDAERVGKTQVADTARGARQRAHRAMTEAERVLLEIVIVEHTPGPADDGVGMNVRHVVEREFSHDLVAHAHDAGQVVKAERVGGAHRGDDARDRRPPRTTSRSRGASSSMSIWLSSVVGIWMMFSSPSPSQLATVRQA